MAKKKTTDIASSSDNIFKFLRKNYDETMALLVLSRNYFQARGQIDRLQLSREETLIYTLAMSTITTQLTSVLSWLLSCRAVQAGEIQLKELATDTFRMPEFHLSYDETDSCFHVLNKPVREMLTRSSQLYNRIKRLENTIQQNLMAQQTV